jgi:endonuclease/exonuclease/phosphatase family metal-dependent hydrolase
VSWGTAAYLPLSGLALASFLLLLPAMLHASKSAVGEEGWVPVALGLALAFAIDASLLLVGDSRDPTTGVSGIFLTAPVVAAMVYLALSSRASVVGEEPPTVPRTRGAIAGLALGSWLFLEYAILSSPYLISRWNSIPLAPAASATVLGILVPVASTLRRPLDLARPWPLLILNVMAFVSLLDYALIHSALLPVLLLLAQVTMVLNLFYILSFLQVGGARQMAISLLYSSLLFLLMLFVFAFTLTYAYVPLRPIWEGKEVVLIPGAFLLLALPVGFLSRGLRVQLRMPVLPRGFLVVLVALPLLLSVIALGLTPATPEPRADGTLRVVTYNVHQGFNNGGAVDPEIFAEVLRSLDADVVALQESDTVRFTSAGLDLVEYLSRRLGYHAFYGPPTWEQSFGVALLSRHPIEEASYVPLSSSEDRRTFIKARIQVEGADVWIFVVHLGLEAGDRTVQLEEILQEASGVKGPVVLAGDFNSCPGGICPGYGGPPDTVYERVTSVYRDVWVEAGLPRDAPEGSTYPAQGPVKRIDYIFVSSGVRVVSVERVMTEVATRASDHLPVMAELELVT